MITRSHSSHAFLHLFSGLDFNTETNSLLGNYQGYSNAEQTAKLNYYGQNSIQVQVKSYLRLFFEEIITPFYVFQIASCILWFLDNYYIYATIIILFSVSSMVVSLLETKRQAQTLHDMTRTSLTVGVCRGGRVFEEVSTEVLVPGDRTCLPSKKGAGLWVWAYIGTGKIITFTFFTLRLFLEK